MRLVLHGNKTQNQPAALSPRIGDLQDSLQLNGLTIRLVGHSISSVELGGPFYSVQLHDGHCSIAPR